MKLNLDKPFYLIAKYWLGDIQGFVKLGDERKEIEDIFKEKYMWKPNTFGVTEESYELLEVNAKVIMTDNEYLNLNDEVETIEEDKKFEKIEELTCNEYDFETKTINSLIKNQRKLIDAVNKLKEEK